MGRDGGLQLQQFLLSDGQLGKREPAALVPGPRLFERELRLRRRFRAQCNRSRTHGSAQGSFGAELDHLAQAQRRFDRIDAARRAAACEVLELEIERGIESQPPPAGSALAPH